MGATSIEWTEATWNPVTGCTKISPGCTHCYAERMAKRLAANPAVKHHERYKGFRVACWPERLAEPLRWKKPRMVFVCSMSDWCHPHVSRDFRLDMLDMCSYSPSESIFQFLTKRPEEMAATLNDWYGQIWHNNGATAWEIEGGPHPRFWFGVSAEDQQRADERYGILAGIPAARRFISFEPLLGLIDCRRVWRNAVVPDWAICGGETGPGARPMKPDWVRSIKDQCVEANVPFLFKSWGKWQPFGLEHGGPTTWSCENPQGAMDVPPLMFPVGKQRSGRLLDGRVWDQFPEASTPEIVDHISKE